MREYRPGLNVHLKSDAHSAFVTAKNRGIIVPASRCSVCGARNHIVGHHDDYAKPLDVRWLCKGCHSRDHAHNEARPIVKTQRMGDKCGGRASVSVSAELWALIQAHAAANHRTIRATVEILVEAGLRIAESKEAAK